MFRVFKQSRIQIMNIFKSYINETLNNNYFVYHYVNPKYINYLKEYGLCSPKELYLRDKELFMNTTGAIYQRRTNLYFNRDIDTKCTPEEILEFHEKSPTRVNFGSDSIFLVLNPIINYHKDVVNAFKGYIEVSVNCKELLQYPVYLLYSKTDTLTTWNKIMNQELLDKTIKMGKQKPKNEFGAFKYIYHISVRCNHIDYDKLNILGKV